MINETSNRFLSFLKRINYREYTIFYALLFMWFVLFITNDNFGTYLNIKSILRESAFVGICAIGMTLCIISGNFDLSVGSMIALLAVETVWLIGRIGLLPTFICVMATGFVFGLFNGLVVVKLRIPAFIATLGTFYIFRAAAYLVTGGAPVKFSEKWFTVWGNGTILSLPIPFVVFVVLTVIGTIILRHMPFGRYILAIGNSEKASKIAGINIHLTKILIFAFVGLFTAISAILISARLWSANPKMLSGYEFKVIAAVVLGGTFLTGGKGSIVNTFFSSIFFVTISNAMTLFRVDSFLIQIVTGLILLLAFSLNFVRSIFENKMFKMRFRRINIK